MKLLRLRADGFGALRGEFHFAPDRLTLVVDHNERGKSTLLSAIVAALYGLDDDRRTNRVLTPVQRWRPWDGGTYRVELDFEGGGRRLTVVRDFEQNTIEVWNEHGRELTLEFREGKDEFPIGRMLFGLDAEEFEKCAFVRQGELDLVVPDEERTRRSSTLHARLENAADSKVGDTNAIEALRALDDALTSYTCPELETTLKIDNAIARLEARREYLGTEILTLEHEWERIAGPLEELARLGDGERATRAALAQAEAERRESRWTEVRHQLDEHQERVTTLEQMRAEAATLASAASVPLDAEAQIRELIGRFDENQRAIAALEARRRGAERERGRLEQEMAPLAAWATAEIAEADRLAAKAAEIRRVDDERTRLREMLAAARLAVTGRGVELDQIEALAGRFGMLATQNQDLLRAEPRLALAFQTQLAGIEQARTAATVQLHAIDAVRHRRRVPGWVLLALGLGAAAAGGAGGAMQATWPWMVALAAGGALALAGLTVLIAGSRARRDERGEARAQLEDAEQQLAQIGQQQREIDLRLAELATTLRYATTEELTKDWHEYLRLTDENVPLQEIRRQLDAFELQARILGDDAARLLERAGGGAPPVPGAPPGNAATAPEPERLEEAAAGIRKRVALAHQLDEFDRSWSWLDDEQGALDQATAEIRSRAARILDASGVEWGPDLGWPDLLEKVGQRVRAAVRHAALGGDEIPRLERLLLDPERVEDLRSQMLRLTGDGGPVSMPGADAPLRPQAEIEGRIDHLRLILEETASRSESLRRQVERADGLHGRHAEHEVERERVERALVKARRFKQAVELARTTIQSTSSDTHRRWAEFLNMRVGELAATVGLEVGQIRFGEDLDFSLRVAGGQPIARGKALLQLSTGARDQLHLAVRLAISEYLSRGREALPLLVDDAFATSDDQRTREGMKLLIGHFSKTHQIVVVTCHRARYDALAALDPELYRDRVQWLDPSASRVPAH